MPSTLFFLFLVSLPLISTLDCYFGESLQDSNYVPPKDNVKVCIGKDARCIKTTTNSDLLKAATFGCDDDGLICTARGIKAGSCKSETKTTMCCCDKNLCNFSGSSSSFLVFILFCTYLLL